ncbi:MAG TPA: hypothetical protein VFV94_01365 [Polyangiaceae bacterium]|nr:hypothetical protein [Polyangiaceae bacterium]
MAAATVGEGLRAGAGTFRMLIDLPARFSVGPVAFAAFSRATDLSPRGIVFYSVYGIGGFLLTTAAFVVAWRSKASRPAQLTLAVSSVCSLLVLVATTQAAPLMWKIGRTGSERAVLADLLDRFVFWTALRVALVDISFLCVVAALLVELGPWPRKAGFDS